jgi:orotidine-5'-phosphate decarboxylase
MDSANEKLFVALDFQESDEALAFVRTMGDRVLCYKVGSEMFTAEGPVLIEQLKGLGKKVFLDLKFHDIPNTVERVSRVVARLGVSIFNVHTSGGVPMMQRAAAACREEAKENNLPVPLVLGVTVLTSFDAGAYERCYPDFNGDLQAQVVHLAALAREAGLDGVVASPFEIVPVKERCGMEFKVLTPGIRPSSSVRDDQRRTMSPGEAMKRGADFLVIGRPITRASEPLNAAEEILAEIEEAAAS